MSNGTSQNHRISLEKARQMTQKYRAVRTQINIPGQAGSDLFPISETFSREAIEALLNQTDCQAVRIYYGLDEQGLHAVLVGIDSNGKDILPATTSTSTTLTSTVITDTTTGDGTIIDEGLRCPPTCPTSSGL